MAPDNAILIIVYLQTVLLKSLYRHLWFLNQGLEKLMKLANLHLCLNPYHRRLHFSCLNKIIEIIKQKIPRQCKKSVPSVFFLINL